MTNTTLADHEIETNEEFEQESQVLTKIPVGTELVISEIVESKLGKYDGVILTVKPVKDNKGIEWDKVHSTSSRVSGKLCQVKLDEGDS